MSTYKFGKYTTWDGYEYFAIFKKNIFGWKEQKYWGLSLFGTHTKEKEMQVKAQMKETVDRLVKAGHTVL